MAARSLLSPNSEFFFLRDAESASRRLEPSQRSRVAALQDGAELRVRSARRAGDPVAAAILFREALLAYARARAVAQGKDAPADPPARALAERLPLVPPDVVEPSAEDTARVRHAVAATDPLYFDAMDRAELGRVVGAMARAVAVARRGVEARSLTNVRGTRVGRAAGTALLLLVVAAHAARAWIRPDLALGKPVRVSSLLGGKPESLVDGDIGTSYAVATTSQENASMTIDLESPRAIATIEVYNRVDGWFDASLPVLLEISLDGTRWNQIARRDTTFSAFPPWTVHIDRTVTRFVRARSLNHEAFALSEIKIYEN
jgi:hypothetical protein